MAALPDPTDPIRRQAAAFPAVAAWRNHTGWPAKPRPPGEPRPEPHIPVDRGAAWAHLAGESDDEPPSVAVTGQQLGQRGKETRDEAGLHGLFERVGDANQGGFAPGASKE